MRSKDLNCYSLDIAKLAVDQYLQDCISSRKRPNHYQKNFINSVTLLNEYHQTGRIKTFYRTDGKRLVFKGRIGSLINEFLSYTRQEERLSITRIACYRRYLCRFLEYCHKNQLQQMKKIDLPLLLRFISSLDDNRSVPVATIVSTLRCFMRYAFVKRRLAIDYSVKCQSAKRPF